MRLFLVLLLLLAGLARAQPLALPPPPDAALQQRIGAQLPLDVTVRDDLGQPAKLADFFQPQRPVLLVPGYYQCPQLCGLVMQDLLKALHDSGVPRSDWRIVRISIDPRDTPADAHRRRDLDLAYAQFLQGAEEAEALPRLDLLVAAPEVVRKVTEAIGFGWSRGSPEGSPAAYGDKGTQIAHPATVVVLTPDGRVARYFNGVGIDANELRGAIGEAAGGNLGRWTDRLAALCAHVDPLVGRHSASVMAIARALALLTLAGLGLVMLRRQRRGERP